MTHQGRHGVLRDENTTTSLVMSKTLKQAIKERASKEAETWGTTVSASDIIRKACERYLETKIPRRAPR